MKASNNYVFDAIVDEIHCIDDECVIFDIINDVDLPTKHCFVRTELLEKRIIVINEGDHLNISASMIPEKNYLDITDCKDLNSNILKKIRNIHIMKFKRKHNSKTKFSRKLCRTCFCKSSPMVVSDKDWIKTILYKGERYKFEYINENGNIKIISFSRVESNSESQINLKHCASSFSNPHKKLDVTKYRYKKIYKTFKKDEDRKDIFDKHIELCRNKIGDVQVKGVCFVGLIGDLEKKDDGFEFDLYTLKSTYKCVLLSSLFSKKFNSISKRRKYLVGGFLADGIIYVIFLHRITKDEENVKGSKKHLGLAYSRRLKELERKFNNRIDPK